MAKIGDKYFIDNIYLMVYNYDRKGGAMKALLTVVMILLSSTSYGQDRRLTPEEAQEQVEELAREIEEVEAENKRLKELSKGDTEAMKKARKILQRQADRDRKREIRSAQVRNSAQISGCSPEDLDKVFVDSRVASRGSLRSHIYVRVINESQFPIYIEDERGPVVSNLCPGGSLTLFRAHRTWQDGNFVNFQYTAKAFLPDGSVVSTPSQRYQLSIYDAQWNLSQNATWQVNIQSQGYGSRGAASALSGSNTNGAGVGGSIGQILGRMSGK